MSLYITSLNSGSNGNCYYVGNEREAVLVDAGISCREIEKRMKRLMLSMDKVRAVFVSHEHTDHIKGIPALAKKYQLPVYITAPTLFNSGFTLDKQCTVPFAANEPVQVGDLTIVAFSKMHDASDPYSFLVTCNQVSVGIFTDIGTPCRNVIHHFRRCHAAFLEANYDEAMLASGHYPYYLKKRISGENGHLSNMQALELFKRHKPSFMSHLILSHLSKNNNCPNLVKDLFEKHAGRVKMVVASRFQATEVYHIYGSNIVGRRINRRVSPSQLSFAFA